MSGSGAEAAADNWSAAVSIFIAGAPSAVAAVARFPAFALMFAVLSSASALWISRHGSMIDDGIAAPLSGVLPTVGVQPATSAARRHEAIRPRRHEGAKSILYIVLFFASSSLRG